MKPQYVFQGVVPEATVRVEIFSGFFRLRRQTNLDALEREPGRITVNGVAVSQPEHVGKRIELAGNAPAELGNARVRASFSKRKFLWSDVATVCTLTWNDAPVPVQVVRAKWFALWPVWVRALVVVGLMTSVLLSQLVPGAMYQRIALLGPVVAIYVLLAIPAQPALRRG